MTMNVNKKMVARLMAVALAATTWGAMASSAAVTMTGKVTDSTCALTSDSQNVAVNLGEPSVVDFTGQAPGYAATSAGFNLNLEGCAGRTDLAVWASGAQTESSLLNSIRNTADTDPASGVAMQVFHNSSDTAMNPNGDRDSAIALTVPDSATHELNFTAKMVKVAATDPTPGNVKGNVTINVAYP